VRFRAAIFDAGDLLYDATDWRRWLVDELAARGIPKTYDELWDPWDERFLPAAHLGRATWEGQFAAYMAELGVTGAAFSDLTAKSEATKRALYPTRRMFPGVRETLDRLRAAGMRLAVLSDSESPAPKVRAGLDDLGLAGCFDAVVASIDIGARKPEPAAYAAALSALRATVDEAVFVGHDADEIRGARDFGLAVVAFNARDPEGADFLAGSFPAIADILLKGG
jgi:HAD superfamily hydrolase (TIGR01509 family)